MRTVKAKFSIAQDTSIADKVLDIFRVMIIAKSQKRKRHQIDNAINGFITDFIPDTEQIKILKKHFKPLPVNTLFTTEERKNSDTFALIQKQVLHYLEVYGLDTPGLFNLEVSDGQIVTLAYVEGVTEEELADKIHRMIYANAPITKVQDLINIIQHYQIDYVLNQIQNNEVRVSLYRDTDKFESGDDAVRYLVLKTTEDSLLIKSPKVLASVGINKDRIPNHFLQKHEAVLAQVFNRHKRIIMALKNRNNSSVINRISRLSKNLHVPLIEAANKTFISKALSHKWKGNIDNFSVRDKFKYLNLLEYKLLQNRMDAFIIRNGKVHLEHNRKTFGAETINDVMMMVILSLGKDLKRLQKKKILLDAQVNYGLPISQKQSLGRLPFGTEVSVSGDEISSGIYWENAWGARDLDLSVIDQNGVRTGWGGYYGYARNNPVEFSGDLTDATNGAMEFMTSKQSFPNVYGLFVSTFSGNGESAGMELVVGHKTEKHWIKDVVIREKTTLKSRGNIIGFVRDGKFIVYYLQESNSRVSGSEKTKILVQKGLAPIWTIRRLFDTLGIKYDLAAKKNKKYDHDLSYQSFSVDKLEQLFYNLKTTKGVP